jgi:hypothetical protein
MQARASGLGDLPRYEHARKQPGNKNHCAVHAACDNSWLPTKHCFNPDPGDFRRG